MYPVTADKKGGFILDLGEANGIAPGARFEAFQSEETSSSLRMAVLVAAVVEPYKATLQAEGDAKDVTFSNAWVLPISSEDGVSITVAIPTSKSSDNPFFTESLCQNIGSRICWVSSEEYDSQLKAQGWTDFFRQIARYFVSPFSYLAFMFPTTLEQIFPKTAVDDGVPGGTQSSRVELIVRQEGRSAVFELTDGLSCEVGLRRLSPCVPLQSETVPDMLDVLDAAIDFFWHLRRTSSAHGPGIKVTVEVRKVERVEGRIEAVGDNLNNDGTVNIIVDDNGDRYGFKLTNHSNERLYVWWFCFNMSDLSIGKFRSLLSG